MLGLVMLLAAASPALAAGPLGREAADSVVLNALKNYPAWKSVEYQGKVYYPGLPIQPTAKIYMERDSLIEISVRVPLMGEVFRGRIDRQEIMVVNKLAKTWSCESVDNLLSLYPGAIGDFQSLLLGRVVILGEGEINLDSGDKIDVYEGEEEGEMIVVPRHEAGIVELTYGYTLLPSGRTAQMGVEIPSRNISLLLDYVYGNGLTINGTLVNGNKRETGKLIFDKVKWGGAPMGAVNIPANFRRVGLAEVLKLKK